MGTQKDLLRLRMEYLQQFSIDSNVALNDALNLPLWFVNSFYSDGAWNIQKAHTENRDQMALNVMQLLENVHTATRNTLAAIKSIK